MTHWLLPVANRTEMEEARKASDPAVLKATLTAFENEMLKEHLWPQARTQLKEAWRAYISKHFAQASVGGPSVNPSKFATPPGSPTGAGERGSALNGFTHKPVSLTMLSSEQHC